MNKESFFDFISKRAWLILLPVVLFLTTGFPRLEFNYNIDSFFDPSDEEIITYNHFKSTFENENDYLLLGIREDGGVFRTRFLRKIDSLTSLLEASQNYKKVISPTRLKETVLVFGIPQNIPVLHWNDSSALITDAKNILSESVYKGLFFSGSGDALCLILKLHSPSTSDPTGLITGLEKLLTGFHFDEFHIAGRAATQFHYKKQMKLEMQLFLLLSVALVFVVIQIIYRSLKIAAIVLLSLSFAIAAVYGWMGLAGYPVTLIQTMLPLLLIITGISPCIHLITTYRNERQEGEKLKSAFCFTVIPNTINTLTTAAGFFSLVFLPSAPVQEFAVVSSAGILITYVVALVTLVSLLWFIKPVLGVKRNNIEEKVLFMSDRMQGVRRPAIIFFVIVFSGGIFSLVNMPVNNNFLDDLPQGSEIEASLHFFENKFSGIRPFEIILSPIKKNDTLLSREKLLEINALQNFASSLFQPGFIFSSPDIVKGANRSMHGGNKKFDMIPDTDEETNKLINKITRRNKWNSFIPVYNSSSGEVRITGKSFDKGSQYYLSRTDEFSSYCREKLKYFKANLTGVSYLLDRANRNISFNLMSGLLLMTLLVFVVIYFQLRSFLLALVAVTVNILPVLFVYLLLYSTGIPLKVSSALIFTIVYGIAVDDTIHFLFSWNSYKERFGNQIAIHKTISQTGVSMTYTTIILSLGFSIFVFSAFPSISIFGIVIASSLFFALLCDLLLLPLILRSLFRQ